jgi:hypothetical protein
MAGDSVGAPTGKEGATCAPRLMGDVPDRSGTNGGPRHEVIKGEADVDPPTPGLRDARGTRGTLCCVAHEEQTHMELGIT